MSLLTEVYPRLAMELARLVRNRERRFAREKARGITAPSPSEPGGPGSPGSPSGSTSLAGRQQQGTQRKCANCGQVGHIKTNKKCAPSFLSRDVRSVSVPGPRKRKTRAPPSTLGRMMSNAIDTFTADRHDG